MIRETIDVTSDLYKSMLSKNYSLSDSDVNLFYFSSSDRLHVTHISLMTLPTAPRGTAVNDSHSQSRDFKERLSSRCLLQKCTINRNRGF